jgi:Tfp pilus assembly protein PilF
VIKRNPTLSAAYVRRAEHYMRRQEKSLAVRELERAAHVNPADVSVLHYLDKVVME